jgi:hypothetical protein
MRNIKSHHPAQNSITCLCLANMRNRHAKISIIALGVLAKTSAGQ